MKKTYSISAMIIMLIIIVLANVVSVRFFSRVDLTDEKIYTLSPYTKKVLKSLDDRLTIKAYFSKNLPGEYSNTRRFLKDELEQYKAYGHGYLRFEFIDPGEEEKLKKEAQNFGIRPVQLQVVENDKMEIKNVYMGVVLLYEDKKEVIPLVQNTKGLEYDITTAITKLLELKEKKIGILSSNKTPDYNMKLTKLKHILTQEYDVIPIDLEKTPQKLDDVSTLIVLAPKEKFTEQELFYIDQFVMNGGNVLWAIDKVDTDIRTAKAEKLELGLDAFLENYGIKINTDIVYDKQCLDITISQRQGFFTIRNQIPYKFFPHITNFNKNISITKNLEEAALYFPSSMDTSFASRKGIKAIYLMKTTENSNVQTGHFNIYPTLDRNVKDTYTGSKIVAAAYVGKFSSYFKDKEIPKGNGADSTKAIASSKVDEMQTIGKMIAIGDGDFVQDDYVSADPNLVLFLNMVDWLNGEEGLISIRSREVTFRPLNADISAGMKTFIKYINIFISPIVLIVFGLIYWFIRRNRKKRGF